MPSEDKPDDRDEDGGGSVNQHTSGMPLAESAENGNTSTTSEEELQHLRSKVVEMESKMVAVDKLHDLHKTTVEAMDYSNLPAVPWSSANGLPFPPKKSHDHSDLYTAIVFFLRWLQQSHQELVKDDLKTKELDENGLEVYRTEQNASANLRDLVTDAFLGGERAKLMQTDWYNFLSHKRSLSECILAPIEIVCGEPDSRTIMQFSSVIGNFEEAETVWQGVERVLASTGSFGQPAGQQPLPERIRIISKYLTSTILYVDGEVSRDYSLTLLRPYQTLVSNEWLFRDRLAALEKHYKDCGELDYSSFRPNDTMDEETLDPFEGMLHLRCLMGFIDGELMPKHKYIRSPRCTSIHFHDLWHLFKPGDEIIQQDGKQALVVLQVQVPRHKIEEPWERWARCFMDGASAKSGGVDNGDSDDHGDNEAPFRLHCAYVDFDGKNFGPVGRTFKILPFDNLKTIKTLPVYPLRYAEGTQTRQKLIKRGRMLLEVSNFKAMYYMGTTLDKRDEIDSQVVIDFSEALADEKRRKEWEPTIGNIDTTPGNRGSACTAACCNSQTVHDGSSTDIDMTQAFIKRLLPDTSLGQSSLILQPRSLEETLSSSSKLSDTELLIMTNRVFGFVLRSRKWAQLDLDLLRYENSNARDLTVDAFERLELPDNHREVLKSLVVQHFRSKQSAFTKNQQTDLIQGKGKGLILLLHGAPGVGKTTTAEGIAELFKRPLFQITCGDLGTTAGEVEAELEKNFSLASRWGCILLLDEADVFLSAREKMDFKRNGLVAVFLRVLEYYSGILFLTTNRIGDFDEAFSSRIHMSLYYPPLNKEKTMKVFKLNLELIKTRFVRQGRSITFDVSAIEKFAETHYVMHEDHRWNGRQIRNACQTALALAEFDSQGSTLEIDKAVDTSVVVELQQKYFETVQKAYLAFDEYLGDVQGTRGDRRAIDYRLRARTETAQDAKNNAFSQHGASGTSKERLNLHPSYPHAQRESSDMSQSHYGIQADQYDPGYGRSTPNTSMSQSHGYGHNETQPRYMQPFQGQSRGGAMANRQIYNRSPEGSQQYQASDRYYEGPQGQHYRSPQVSDHAVHSAGDIRYSDPSYGSSPGPSRGVQQQRPLYGYGNSSQGGIEHGANVPMQSAQSSDPDSTFRSGQDGPDGQGNGSSIGNYQH